MKRRLRETALVFGTVLALAAAACTPAAAPSPTAASAKPAPTTAPAKQAAKPAATTAPAKQAAKPAATQAPAKPAFDEKAVADFYKGQTVKVVVGYTPGGGFDTYARAIARHIGKYIPGQPNVIVENMPGAGSMVAANHLYKAAQADGLTFGTFNEFQLINQLTGKEGVEFDARKFSWVGSSYASTIACVARADTPFKTFQDVLKAKEPFVVGGTAPGSETDDGPRVLEAATGANLKIVSGYAGTSKIRLAIESSEVDGACWSWQSIKSTAQNWLDEKYVNVLVQLSREGKIADLKDVPAAQEFAKDDDALKMMLAWAGPQAMAKAFAAPPGVPADRLAALQKAFLDTFKDPGFIEDAKKGKLDLEPKSGTEVAEVVKDVFSVPDSVAKNLAKVLNAQ